MIFFLALLALPASAQAPLSDLVATRIPWLTWEANSEQRQPVYLGKSPLDIVREAPDGPALLPIAFRAEAEDQLRRALSTAGAAAAELEAWPAYDDEGRLTMAIARWRPEAKAPWRWLSGPDAAREGRVPAHLPRALRPSIKEDQAEIYQDFSLRPDLYGKPVFGDCVWTDEEGKVAAGWRPLGERDAARAAPPAPVCRVLPMPCYVNGQPRSFVVAVDSAAVRWPAELAWSAAPRLPPPPDAAPRLVWPASFRDGFMADVRALDGEGELAFPRMGVRVTRKSSSQKDNQLGTVLDWLEGRYAQLGIKTMRDRFYWRGLPQSNLVAVIPGRLKAADNRPVLLVDHVDTAFSEDVFKSSGARESAPGADDNASATSALLRAAEAIAGLGLRHDVWLVHVTGEEFPADDLGARRLIRNLLSEKRRVGAVLVLDMIAWRRPGDPVFQVNAGEGEAALKAAQAAVALAKAVAPGFTAALRTRFDPESYLYNTDGVVFSHAGFPAVLFNEHINAKDNLDRPHYHESSDVAAFVDPALGEAVTKVAAETAVWLASQP